MSKLIESMKNLYDRREGKAASSEHPAGEVALRDDQLDEAKGGIAPTGCVRGPGVSAGIVACKPRGAASVRLICTQPWRPGRRYKLW